MLNARLLLWPTLDQPPQRAGGAVPGCFLLAFLGTFAAIEEELNPATTPRDTLTVYCNTALCVKAQLSHTEAKPPLAAAPTDKFPCWQGSGSELPSAGGCSGCPVPTGRGPPTCSVQNPEHCSCPARLELLLGQRCEHRAPGFGCHQVLMPLGFDAGHAKSKLG